MRHIRGAASCNGITRELLVGAGWHAGSKHLEKHTDSEWFKAGSLPAGVFAGDVMIRFLPPKPTLGRTSSLVSLHREQQKGSIKHMC